VLTPFATRLLPAVVLVIAAAGAGHACATLDGSCGYDGCGTTATCAGDCAGKNSADDAATPSGDEASGEARNTSSTDGASTDGENGGAAEKPAEAPKEPACMLDVFKRLAVGDWVRTRWTNKETHTLLVAAKDDKTITIEEIVNNPKLKAPIGWTQLDVSLEDGTLVALRDRLADGTIEEREPTADAQRGTSDLLTEPFRPDGGENLRLDPIDVYDGGTKTGVKRGLFLCRRYRITVEKNRYAHVWFSRVKLPQYPVKIHYYEENLTILLEAFGTARASEFTTKPEPPRRGRTKAE
jgi:hypothetical protein